MATIKKTAGKPAAKPAAKTAPGRPGFGGPRKPLTKAEQKAREAARAERLKFVTFAAPDEFKTTTYAIKFGTQHDGTIHPSKFRVETIKGKWDNPESRRFDLALFDQPTIAGLMARLSSMFHHNKVERRLPPNMVFYIVVAVRSDKNGNIGMSLRQFAYDKKVEKAGGKKGVKRIAIERAQPGTTKTGPQLLLARLKRQLKFFRGAFVAAVPTPSITQYKALEKAALGEGGED